MKSKAAKMVKHRTHQDFSHMMLPGLLRLMGFSRQEVRDRKSGCDGASLFYTRPHRENEWALKEIYEAARDKYRARVKQLHPDRGGTHEECAQLNLIWDRVKYLLKRRGLEI